MTVTLGLSPTTWEGGATLQQSRSMDGYLGDTKGGLSRGRDTALAETPKSLFNRKFHMKENPLHFGRATILVAVALRIYDLNGRAHKYR